MRNASGALLRLLYFFLAILYVFATVGNMLFAGKIVKNQPELRWYQFGDVYNFDTFVSSLVCTYVTAFIANWTVIMDALIVGTNAIAARVFFFSCRILFELVVVPVVFGAIIEQISGQLDLYDQRKRVDLDRMPFPGENTNPFLDESALVSCNSPIVVELSHKQADSDQSYQSLDRNDSAASDVSLP